MTSKWYESSKEQTSKECPVCGNTNIVKLSKYDMKVCTDHKEFVMIPWTLDKGQKPLV